LHHHADRRWCGIPDSNALLRKDVVPGLGIELGFNDEVRHTMRQRRVDPVAGTGDPARVGSAPEDIIIMQIEGEKAGDMMRDDRLWQMDRALWPAGGAAGEG